MGKQSYGLKIEKRKGVLVQIVCTLLICFGFILSTHRDVRAAAGSFEFEASAYTAYEGTGKVDITIKRVGGSDGIATVDWKTKGVSAKWGDDYGNFGWTTLSFADGETSKVKSVSIVNDSIAESDEVFNVLLGNPTGGATLGAITTTAVTIKDGTQAAPAANPGSFGFEMAGYIVNEGDGTVAVTINRLGGSDGVATVDWKTKSVTAKWGADYGNFGWTTLTFADGETSKTGNIAIVSDTVVEGDETFNVLLGNPAGGATLDTITTATVTIKDGAAPITSEPAPTPVPGAFEFAVGSYTVSEGAGKVDVTIKRVGGSDGVATVDWKTKGVTAKWGEDYGNFGWTTLTFADGETSKVKSVAIVSDTVAESDEVFNVLLGNTTGGASLGGVTTAAVTIQDEAAPTTSEPAPAPAPTPVPGAFEFAVGSYSVSEGAGQVDITIKRVGGSDGVATVDWKTQGVTATYGEDYGNFGWTTLTFADGETSKVKSIAIVHDSIVENDEIFDVLLGNPTGGATLGSVSSAAVTIVDDDTDVGGSEPVAEEPTAPSVSYLPVFPGAQGFGTETKAGRGGKIVKVTNLNDSGTGSLRAAIAASGPRIIVFEVSGTISLSSKIEITNPYVTIAGQTAPSPGILIKGDDIIVCTHDVLIQHIRSRHGSGSTGDSIAIGQYNNSNVYNVVLDHVSASWGTDENGNTWFEPRDVTISNSIFSEGLNGSGHGMGLLVGDSTKRVAVIGNLFAHNYQRNPLVKGGASAVVLNNVMYDGGILWMYFDDPRGSGPIYASTVGNVFIDGPSTSSSKYIQVKGTVQSGTKIYLSDNKAIGSGTLFTKGTSFDPRVSTPPVWHPSLSVRSSGAVESWVLSNAGARPADRDPVDERIVNEVKTRSGSIIDNQSDVGGFPSLAKNVRTFPVPSNPSGDDDGDGYTNIEEILHQMAAQVEGK